MYYIMRGVWSELKGRIRPRINQTRKRQGKLNLYLGFIPAKRAEPNSFGYESKGSLEAHTEASYKHDSVGL